MAVCWASTPDWTPIQLRGFDSRRSLQESKKGKKMTSLTIQTNANDTLIDAIKTLLLSVDPNAIINSSYDELSQEDTEHLKKLYEKKQDGKLKFYNEDELKERLNKKGYKW